MKTRPHTKICNNKECGAELIVGENWYLCHAQKSRCICIPCFRKMGEEKRRAKGMRSRGLGWSKYGVKAKLPDGRMNPEYTAADRRSKGIKPHPPNWGNTYGVPKRLPNGIINLEWLRRYSERQRRKDGRKIQTHRFGHRKLPNGQQNPAYEREYARYWRQTEVGKIHLSRNNARHRKLPPLKIVFGRPSKGLELHHMSKTVGIWIPRKINRMHHNLWTGKNMEKVNDAAFNWYFEQWGITA